MSDETRRILDLLAQGKISVDEADQLLRAVQESRGEAQPGAAPPAENGRHYLRVRDRKVAAWPGIAGDAGDKRNREINIRVPVSLIRSGIRLGAMIPGAAGDELSRRLRERGIDVDLAKLDGPALDTLLKNLGDLTLDVDQGKAEMRITYE